MDDKNEQNERTNIEMSKMEFSEIMAFCSPPESVKLVLGAVCVLFRKAPTWIEAVRLMGGNRCAFLEKINTFDKDNIPGNILHKLQRDYINNPDFNEETICKYSTGAAVLCKWVHDVSNNGRILKRYE